MRVFLVTFFLLYGGVHVYAFVKARNAHAFGTVSLIVLAGFMVCMVLAPVLVRVVEKRGLEGLGRVLASVGYTWMGFLFLFFTVSLAFDLWQLLLLAVGHLMHRDLSSLIASSRTSFTFSVAWGCIVCIYGAYEAGNIRLERIVIETPKLASGKITLAQISDVHLGLMVRERRILKMVERLREADPDIIVSTGDLVDGQLDGLAHLTRFFSDLRPRLGKFAVTGNHELYAGLRTSVSLTEQAGFRLLRNEGAVIPGSGLTLAGVDDPAVSREATPGVERELLARLDPATFRILLKHRPHLDRDHLGLIDLQLSGHVHKGQIFPFNLVTYLFYPVQMGLSKAGEGSSLYVSRGTGTWGPPIRFLAPPEVTVFEIIPGFGN